MRDQVSAITHYTRSMEITHFMKLRKQQFYLDKMSHSLPIKQNVIVQLSTYNLLLSHDILSMYWPPLFCTCVVKPRVKPLQPFDQRAIVYTPSAVKCCTSVDETRHTCKVTEEICTLVRHTTYFYCAQNLRNSNKTI